MRGRLSVVAAVIVASVTFGCGEARETSTDAGEDGAADVSDAGDVRDSGPMPETREPRDSADPPEAGPDGGGDADAGRSIDPAYGLSDQEVLDRPYHPVGNSRDYEKSIDRPECDGDDPEVVVVEPDDDLESTLNRDDARIFCVTPGDYSDQNVNLTTSGSDGAPRWIRLYDPNASGGGHPWNRADPETRGAPERALLGELRMRGEGGWRIDRIRFDTEMTIILAEDVILNELMFYKNSTNVQLRIKRSTSVTVQNSVIGKTAWGNRDKSCDTDANSISLQGGLRDDEESESRDVHIVDNELFDFWCGDGVQTLKEECYTTVIQDNDIYTTAEFNDAGHPVENGIDLKCGPADVETGSLEGVPSEDWSLVENNRLWGQGSDMIYHWPEVSGITIRANRIWDVGQFGYHVSAKEEINVEHHFYDNILYDTSGGMKPRHIDESLYARNIFVEARGEDVAWAWFANPENNRVTRNVFIDTDVSTSQMEDLGNVVEQNAYYGSQPFDGTETGRIERDNAVDAEHDDLNFEYKKWTDPSTMTIPMGSVTDSSPHAEWFGGG